MLPVQIVEGILDNLADGVLLCHPTGRITYVNSRMQELFGYGEDELVGQNVEMLLPGQLRENHLRYREAYAAAPMSRPMAVGLDLVGRRKDGSEFPLEVSLDPLDKQDGLQIIATVRDVTLQRQQDRERTEAREQVGVLEERQRIAMDLHDGIMQSVFAVGLKLELAGLDLPPEAEAAKAVDAAIDDLHDVVRDIRSYIFDLRPRDFDGDLGNALANLVREFEDNSRIPTRLMMNEEVARRCAQAEAVAVHHIVHEALSNARKHALATSVEVRVDSQDGQWLVVEVEDEGKGFDVSSQFNETHRGLRNMHERVRALGGRFGVWSTVGVGTTIQAQFAIDPIAP